jgi:hypothetical protein
MTDFPTQPSLYPYGPPPKDPKDDKLTGGHLVLVKLMALLVFGVPSVWWVWKLVDEIKFGSRALAAEAVVVRSGSLRGGGPFVLVVGERGVLVKSDKLAGTAVIVAGGWWFPPAPGERIPILYEPDREQTPPASQFHVMDDFLERYTVDHMRDSSVRLDSFWRRYLVPLAGVVLCVGCAVLFQFSRGRKILAWFRWGGVKQW